MRYHPTPRPWRTEGFSIWGPALPGTDAFVKVAIMEWKLLGDPADLVGFAVSAGEATVNAQHIVLCVNLFEELVKEVRAGHCGCVMIKTKKIQCRRCELLAKAGVSD